MVSKGHPREVLLETVCFAPPPLALHRLKSDFRGLPQKVTQSDFLTLKVTQS